jgi:predicted permease
MILNAFNGVLTLMFLIFVGYALGKKGLVSKSTSNFITSILIYVSLPAFMISNMTTKFNKDEFSSMLFSLLLAFLCQALMFLIGLLAEKILKIDFKSRGTYCSLFALSNALFIGLPVCISIFGDEALPFILTFYVANTLCFWTLGVYFMNKNVEYKKANNIDNTIDNKIQSSIFKNLKNLLTPPLIAFAISIVLILLNIKLPTFLLDSFRYLGAITTPLSTIFIGSILSSINLSKFKFEKKSISIIIGRFLIAPALTASLLSFTNLSSLNKEVFIIMASMPVMNLVAIMSKKYGGDYEFATIMNPITLIASFVFIPIYIGLFTIII